VIGAFEQRVPRFRDLTPRVVRCYERRLPIRLGKDRDDGAQVGDGAPIFSSRPNPLDGASPTGVEVLDEVVSGLTDRRPHHSFIRERDRSNRFKRRDHPDLIAHDGLCAVKSGLSTLSPGSPFRSSILGSKTALMIEDLLEDLC
jgi:hypothetical protein